MGPAATLVLVLVLGVAGVTKLRGPLAFRVTLKQLAPSFVARPLTRALPVIELSLAMGLLSGVNPPLFGALSIGLLALFTAALVAMWKLGISQDCGCFGEAREAESPLSGIVRNFLLIGLAAVVVVDPETIWAISVEDAAGAATVALGLLVLWLTASTLATRRAILFLPRGER